MKYSACRFSLLFRHIQTGSAAVFPGGTPGGFRGTQGARGRSFSGEKIKKKKFSRLLLTIKINRDILVSTKQKGLDTVKINEIISEVLNNTIKQDGRKKTQTDIAAALGVKPQIVNDRLKNENMKVNTAIEMLAEMGYEIVVRPAAASDKRESYIVEKGGPRVR